MKGKILKSIETQKITLKKFKEDLHNWDEEKKTTILKELIEEYNLTITNFGKIFKKIKWK